jgi:hypothetical protein
MAKQSLIPVSHQPSNDVEPTARRAMKRFDQTFSKGRGPRLAKMPPGPPEATRQLRYEMTPVNRQYLSNLLTGCTKEKKNNKLDYKEI